MLLIRDSDRDGNETLWHVLSAIAENEETGEREWASMYSEKEGWMFWSECEAVEHFWAHSIAGNYDVAPIEKLPKGHRICTSCLEVVMLREHPKLGGLLALWDDLDDDERITFMKMSGAS